MKYSSVSPKTIDIDIYNGAMGMKPDGYQILRKTKKAKKYQKIKTIKAKNLKTGEPVHFTDKKVSPLATYVYKVRSYKKIGKKTYYSPYSKGLTKRAVNNNALFTVTGDPDAPTPVLKLTGDRFNGISILYPQAVMGYGYASKTDDTVCYRVVAVSTNGVNWVTKEDAAAHQKPGEEFELNLGGCERSFWLKFEKADRPQDDPEEYPAGNLCTNGLRYEGIPVYLDLYPYDGSARTFRDSEAIH